jgi:hypothetical protein
MDIVSVPRFTPHPKSVPGDFYVEKGQCMACGVPHVVAPDLVGWTGEGKMQHCFWKKQPETKAELERAISVLEAQELECHRYAGTDPAILDRVLSTCCDYPTQLPSALHDRGAIDPVAPRFTLRDDHPGVITRLLKAIVGRRKANRPVTPV